LVEIPNNPTRCMDWIPTNVFPFFIISLLACFTSMHVE
jgi:hypothetical protein